MNLNRTVISGNLTRDPELRTTSGGTSLCKMRVAVNTRRKQNDEWVDVPNFFNVTVWGKQGENCTTFLAKGSPIAVDGRLQWSEWEDGEKRREAVEIIADQVQFLRGSNGDEPQQQNDNEEELPF